MKDWRRLRRFFPALCFFFLVGFVEASGFSAIVEMVLEAGPAWEDVPVFRAALRSFWGELDVILGMFWSKVIEVGQQRSNMGTDLV
jgi:hypothetical protein